MRVESASASSIECVVKITEDDLFTAEIRDITFHMNRLAAGSIPVDGSSKKIIEGFPSIAMATLKRKNNNQIKNINYFPLLLTLSFLLLPPEKVPARIPSNWIKSISNSFFSTKRSRSSCGMPLIAAYRFRCSRAVRLSKSASNYGQYPIFIRASSS